MIHQIFTQLDNAPARVEPTDHAAPPSPQDVVNEVLKNLIYETPVAGIVPPPPDQEDTVVNQIPWDTTTRYADPEGQTTPYTDPDGQITPIHDPNDKKLPYTDPSSQPVPFTATKADPVAYTDPNSQPVPYTAPKVETVTHGTNVELSIALLDHVESEQLRARWNEIQNKFVDEPRVAVQQADTLVTDVIEKITQVFINSHTSLESQWNQGNDVSTENLRKALQHYRSFFNRLVA
jgi:hypothetical protein